ncbi:CD209 [Branchiostoma lanceolatum]|uniref:CD209 protein n=1 Tax=Branchiostoma lanceolatum TaxID=7740 RepID=A0A8K0ERL9_BRALA|nr:CD209 [Branchiostoma lanceolatum]
MRGPGQSRVRAGTMLKIISVLSLVLKCCLLCVVIFLVVTMSELKMSVNQIDEKTGLSAERLRTAALDLKLSINQLDEKLERTIDNLTNVSDWPQQAIGKIKERSQGLHNLAATLAELKASEPPGTQQGGGKVLQRLEQLEGDVKNLKAKSENTCAVPKDPSTCPSGYRKYRGVCYGVFDTVKTFHESAAFCEDDGGTLAMPRDAGINAFLVSLMDAVDKEGVFWFGLHDQEEEGTWKWLDGAAVTGYSAWGEGEPDDRGVTADCAQYLGDSRRWNSDGCHYRWGLICQIIP